MERLFGAVDDALSRHSSGNRGSDAPESMEIVSKYHYLQAIARPFGLMKKTVILSITEETQEIRSLLDTLNVVVLKEFIQIRSQPHKTGFLGPGKIEEILKDIESFELDMIVINGKLKPSQHHFLEMKFQKECIDRPGVILRIFSDHAHTPEAIAQVTLAKLRYELPFLREWIHKSKSGDRPGFLSGGAYATDVYFEHARSHARHIEKRLEELSRQREVTRTKRRDSGYTLVSLAGYTNAGKSALMNKVCKAEVEVDPRLFSTLSTTTRKVIGVSGNILMTDTVGFIKDLPPDLVKAFNSTLEEIFYADLILLVIDLSEPHDVIKSKLSVSMDILLPKVEGRSLVVVGNKIDLIQDQVRDELRKSVSDIIAPHDIIMVSANTGEGLEILRTRLSLVQGLSWLIDADLPLLDSSYSILSRIRSIAEVVTKTTDSEIKAEIRCKPTDAEKIVGWLGTASASKVISSAEVAEALKETPAEPKGAPSSEEVR